ncbi:hypothetical protein MTO96_017078 [Rhipicephalus appendiculatus]
MPRQAPFDTIAMDHVGPIHTEDPSKYFITAVDVTTRFIITRAVPDKSTEEVLSFLDEDIVFIFGTPTVVTDNDRVFTSCNTLLRGEEHRSQFDRTLRTRNERSC